MPIYEYQCMECGELHEALQKMSDAPLAVCPACGKEALRKNVTAAAFRLKGGGWYETDFKSGNKKNIAGDSGGESKSGDGKSGDGDAAAGKKEGAAKEATPAAKATGDSGAAKAAKDS